MVASVIWSLLNRTLLGSWIDRVGGSVREFLWGSFATLAQNLAEQAWVADLVRFAGSGGRLALLGGVLLVGYIAALTALRRLLMQPAPVPGSNW
jgi:hypothetical protein